MNWFIVVYFLVNSSWIEADNIGKEGWSPILQEDYKTCITKTNESNERFEKIAEYRKVELDIKFQCECRKNIEQPDIIGCKQRNWLQNIWDKFFLFF